MANSYGNYDPTTAGELADGKMHDAGDRVFTKVFDLATDGDPAGGTTNLLHIGRVRKGSVITPEVKIASGANLSAINLSIGTLASDALYSAAAAGPNNTTQTRDILPAMQGVPLTVDTDVYVKPSGAWPATGRIVTTLRASHR